MSVGDLCLKVKFRQPETEECDVLWQIALDAKQYWGYDETFMQACRDELKVTSGKLHNHHYHYQLVEYDGSVVGFYCLERINSEELEVDALFISPEFIGKGLGTQMWTKLVADAIAFGGKKLVIASDPFAEPFYLKMGAQRVGEIASGSIPGRVLPLMECAL